jgi:hypothetical protein
MESLENISAFLKEARVAKGQDVAHVASRLRVRPEYIAAIDAGEWGKLSDVYALGYVREYANALGLDGRRIAAEFKKHYTHTANLALIAGRNDGRMDKAEHAAHYRDVPGLPVKSLLAGLALAFFGYMAAPQGTREVEEAFSPQGGLYAGAPSGADAVNPYYIPAAYRPAEGKKLWQAPAKAEEPRSRRYLIHAGENAALRLYGKAGTLLEEARLSEGEAFFAALPEGGYVEAAGDPAKIEVYTEDMTRRIGDVRSLFAVAR